VQGPSFGASEVNRPHAYKRGGKTSGMTDPLTIGSLVQLAAGVAKAIDALGKVLEGRGRLSGGGRSVTA